jgi:outer membrane protein assembly factor BamB
LLKQYDKDGDGLISADEFPAMVPLARRPEASVAGVDLTLPGKNIFAGADANKDGKLDKAEWDAVVARASQRQDHGLFPIKTGGKGDVTSSHVLWQESRSVAEAPTPLYSNGRVYMVTNGGVVTCMEAATGKLVFRNRLGAGGSYFASPVLAGGNVYFSSGDGMVSVIRDSDRFELVSKSDLQEPIFATPAILDGTVYLRTDQHLYAFGKAGR